MMDPARTSGSKGTSGLDAPATVLALAAAAGAIPLAWHEYPDRWVIVMQDGRKLRFAKQIVTKASADVATICLANRPPTQIADKPKRKAKP